jgi:hypothetical protein
LWAQNEAHLTVLENYVGALLREREPNINASHANRLPTWIKRAKHRTAILECIGGLRRSLVGARAPGVERSLKLTSDLRRRPVAAIICFACSLNSGARAPLAPMVLVRCTHRATLALGPAALLASCGPATPTRPDELRAGTFALSLRGTTGWPGRTVALDERVTGTACRVGSFVRLDSRDLSRRWLFWFPALGPTPARYRLESHDTPGTATGHLKHARYGGYSLHLVSGSTDVVAPVPADVHGTLRARLVEILVDGTAAPDSAAVSGVFRADACFDWRPPPTPREPAP